MATFIEINANEKRLKQERVIGSIGGGVKLHVG